MDQQKVERIVRELLVELGEDPDREGLLRTPARVAAALDYLTSGSDSIGAQGVGVVVEARHLCTMMRGIEKQNTEVITSSVLGSFRSSAATRAEFLSLVHRPRQ